MKILFLVPYPLNEAPSQRFRFEQYFQVIAKDGHLYSVMPFLNSQDWKIFYQSGRLIRKFQILLMGIFSRFLALFQALHYDFIFIHRELAPIGPPILEWLVAKVFRKKIIYDFDDAIWQTDNTNESSFEKMIRWRSKVASICKWSYKVSCGNEYLANYARQFNDNVLINPTTIDMEHVQKYSTGYLPQRDDHIVIGWTGSHSTLKYLKQLEPVLQHIEKMYPKTSVQVIADRAPKLALERLMFVPWSKVSEIRDLQSITIGIMPLPDDEWTRGKCGFKALQYMALGIPAVVSPVGVNSQITRHGQNGLFASTPEEWITALQMLILNQDERKRIGEAGKKTVDERYSVSSNEANFLGLFN